MLLREEITQYVVDALGRHHSNNDIIQYLCENANMKWPEAEKLVKQIKVSHGSEIKGRQSPLVIMLGIMGFLTGVILVAYGVFYFFTLFTQDTSISRRGGRDVFVAAGAFITGLGMITGAIFGTWNAIKEYFENRDNR